MRFRPTAPAVLALAPVVFGALLAGACGDIASVGATSAPTLVDGGTGGTGDGATADSGLIIPDSGPPVDPPRCSNRGERPGTQVTVIDESFGPVAFSVAENCEGIHVIWGTTVIACPYTGCPVGGTFAGKSIDAFGATGYGIVSAGNRVYVARSGDPATRTAGVFSTSFDLTEGWQVISERPTQTATLRRFHGQALGETVAVGTPGVSAYLYPTTAGGVEQDLAGDYGDPTHLSRYFSNIGNGRALYRGHSVAASLFEFVSTPSVAVVPRGLSRIALSEWVLGTATRAVGIEKVGTDFGVLSCPLDKVNCLDSVATAPIAPGFYGPFYAAHGRIYGLRNVSGLVWVAFLDDAALAASKLTATLLGDPLPFKTVYDFDADDDHLYVRGSATSNSKTSVVRIAK